MPEHLLDADPNKIRVASHGIFVLGVGGRIRRVKVVGADAVNEG